MIKMTVCPKAKEDVTDNFRPGDGYNFGVILIDDSDGHVVFMDAYRDGEHMSWARQDGDEALPYVSNVLQGLIDKYGVTGISVQAQQCLRGHEKEAYHICEMAFTEQFCSNLILDDIVLTDDDLTELENAAGNGMSIE